MYVRRQPFSHFSGMIVPTHSVDTFIDLGFVLLDQPGCSGARMLPPRFVGVHRVTSHHENIALPGQKCPGRDGVANRGRNDLDNDRNRTGRM